MKHIEWRKKQFISANRGCYDRLSRRALMTGRSSENTTSTSEDNSKRLYETPIQVTPQHKDDCTITDIMSGDLSESS